MSPAGGECPRTADTAAELRRSIAIVYLSSLLAGMVGVTLPASSVFLRERLALSDSLYGALYLPGYALALVTSLIGPRLVTRYCLKRLFMIGLAFQAAGMMFIAASGRLPRDTGVAVLFGGVALTGPAGGLLGICINTAAIELFPRARTNALAALHGLLGAGASIGPGIVAASLAGGLWSAAPLFYAAGGLALVFFSGRAPVQGLPDEAETFSSGARSPRRIWLHCGAPFLYGIAEATFTAWMVIFLREKRGLPREAAAGALSAFWILMTAGRLLAAWFIRRLAPSTMALGLSAAMAVAFPLVAASDGATDAIVRFAFAGAACSALFPILMAIASLEFPERTSRVSALFSAAVLLGLGVGSFAVGPLRAWLKLETIYRLSMVWPLLLAFLVVLLQRRKMAR